MSRLILSQITIKKERSISSTTWYYLLQPSNASAPDPTSYGNPPPTYTDTGYSGWSTTEPTYTVGDDRVLYIMVQTLYSDNTFSYATPTISSSYEAAKDAYNEIIQAEQDISELQNLGLAHGYVWDNMTAVPATSTIPIYPVGTYIASGILVSGSRTITRNNSNTYGLNTWISTGGINLRYNAIDLMKLTTSNLEFYYPSTSSQGTKAISLGTNGAINSLVFYGFNNSNKTMELTNNALNFYNPADGSTLLSSLTSDGLILSKGGIIVGSYNSSASDVNQNFVYLSSEDYGTGIQIGNSPAGKTDWRQIIGNKFGIDKAGNLYASNANISGAITATSLTISDGGSTYSGISAINASGYTIEIINNAGAKPNDITLLDNQTYLYPIMRRNGEVVNYLLTSDTTREPGKSYYIRTYDSSTQTYTYTLVSNPSDNPQAQSYYEAIDKTLYIWTYNDIQPGVHGDSHLGGIVATYNRTYRVSYALSDDEVGQATSSQIIEVDPQKYITQINEYGIKIHPETWTNQSNYIQLDGTGMEVFEIGQTDVSVAFFGASGSRIGAENTSNVITTPNGIAVRDGLAELAVMSKDGFDVKTYDANDNEVVIAHLGFGPGTDSGGGISDAPYYTLGTRVSGSTVGNYSHAEGYNTIASAYCAHAEGGTRSVIVSPETIASGEYSHAEGGSTTASAGCSHAEGYATVASGPHSHAEGFYTTAEGTNSHAGGCGTTVRKFNQTAIGEYNEIDNYADTHGKYAFIIGNGTSNNARSNAFTVDWNGNIRCAGGITATPTIIPLTFSQCTTGSYTRCYRIGNIVFLSFNINITTATTSYDYITGLPPALGGGWGCAGVTTGGSSIRFWVTTDGTLRTDGAAYTGWYNGSITYICQ